MANTHQGRCLCGAVSYETHGKPKASLVCHCKFCQRRTGSNNGFLVYFHNDAVKSLTGPLKTYRHISDGSGRWVDVQFCEKCGSSVTWTLELAPSWRGFDAGTFDDNSIFPRNVHMWTDNSHPSEKFSEDDICYPVQPPFNTEQLEKI